MNIREAKEEIIRTIKAYTAVDEDDQPVIPISAPVSYAHLRYVILIIPAAFVLSRFLGAAGVWHAFWITEWITAATSWYIYRKHAVEKA